MKTLELKELTTQQKLGMVMAGHVWENIEKEDWEYTLNLIRNHALGAIWVDPGLSRHKEVIAQIKAAADYPILVICDAEMGIGGRYIGKHNALACTGSEELAYIFGKVTAITARQMGYSVVCGPVVDMVNTNKACGMTVRSMGSNKYKVSALAVAEAQGMHDGGVLTVGKHYPGAMKCKDIDTHMAEPLCEETAEELLDYALFPYLKLMERELLDGIMVGHELLPKIDPVYPASLSEKVIGLIREQGFEGFAITDALCMMGVVAKYGDRDSKGLAIAGGNDLALPWYSNQQGYEALCESYEKGLISDERLNEAVSRILKSQSKTLNQPAYTELTAEDLEKYDCINKNAVYARTDDGVSASLSRDGRHFFVVLTESTQEIMDSGKVNVDQLLKGWYRPDEIMDKLEKEFPNSASIAIHEFPTPAQIMRVLEDSVGYEDAVFITFVDTKAYVGRECFTSRIVSMIEALQITDRVSTIVHFGNPFVLEELEHVPRILIGTTSDKSVGYTLDVMAGKYPPMGTLTYDIKFK